MPDTVVTLLSLSGAPARLPPLPLEATVRDLALQVRAQLSMPISVQNLVHGSGMLTDPSLRLVDVFGAVESVELTVVRRPFTPEERALLHKRLVRAAAGGHIAQFRELLMEGAQVNFQPEGHVVDTSVSLTHWTDEKEDVQASEESVAAALGNGVAKVTELRLQVDNLDAMADYGDRLEEKCVELGVNGLDLHPQDAVIVDASGKSYSGPEFAAEHPNGPPEESFPFVFVWSMDKIQENAKQRSAMEDSDSEGSDSDSDMFGAERRREPDASSRPPCGGLTPLLVAIAAGDEELARDLRQLGAEEPDLKTRHAGLPQAFQAADFADVVKHLIAGADVNMRLRRGQGVNATDEGAPLHACAHLHRHPGAYEVAQILIRKKADMSAGDSEGDNPMAHARYFNAIELFQLFQGHGAKIEGPFFERFGRV